MAPKHIKKLTREQQKILHDPAYVKEYEYMKKKYPIPKGESLEDLKSTKEGLCRYNERKSKWDEFYKKWNIVFFIGEAPILRAEKKNKQLGV